MHNGDNGYVFTHTGQSDFCRYNCFRCNTIFWCRSNNWQVQALTKSGNQLDVAVDDSSIEVNADAVRVKALGITNAMLAGNIDMADLK